MAEESEEKKEPEIETWKVARVSPEEAIEVLERKASQEQSMQARLVENGDRKSPHVGAMRDAHVLFHVAAMLRLKMANEQTGRRGSSMPQPRPAAPRR